MTVARAMRSPEETLDGLGIPPAVLERWRREIDRCTTLEQVTMTAACHRMEAHLIGRYGA